MNTLELLDIIDKDDVSSLDEWLKNGGDPNSVVQKKSLLAYSLEKGSDSCSFILLLHGAHNAEPSNPKFAEMIKETRDSIKLMREVPLRILGALDDYSLSLNPNKILVEPRDIISKEINGANVLKIGLHHFEMNSRDFCYGIIDKVLDSSLEKGKYACVVSTISKRFVPESDQFKKRITGFLIFREVPYELYGQVTMGIKMVEEEALVGVVYSDEPLLVWNDEEKQFDVDIDYIEPEQLKEIKSYYKFKEITKWSHDLNLWAQQFQTKKGVYPNILLASGDTFNRIDLVANTNSPDNITNAKGNTSNEFVKMTGFKGPGYSLEFCVDDSLKDDHVVLINAKK